MLNITDKSKGNFVQTKISKYYYLDKGKGDILIILPSYSYKVFIDKLSQKYRVIIPDLLKGLTKSSKKAYSCDDYIDLLNDFIDSLKLKKFYLVGISFSGPIAFKFSQKYSKKVRKMMLFSTSLVDVPITYFKFIYSYLLLVLNNSFSIRGIKSNIIWFTDGLSNLFRHKQVLIDLNIAVKKYPKMDHTIKVATKIILADRDEFIPIKYTKEMHKIKKLDLEIIKGNHAWFFNDKEKFIELIDEYCN